MTELLFVAGGGLAVVVLLGVSAFFSSSEIALFSLRKCEEKASRFSARMNQT
jgi:CBS domain containing-hemolysin-like protein